MKYDEPRLFKKKGSEDHFKFNLKVADAIEEAKDACTSHKLDKVRESLEKGEKLLEEDKSIFSLLKNLTSDGR